MVFIYALADPRMKHPVKRFFYVGSTKRRLQDRLKQHLRDAQKGNAIGCFPWIRGLLRLGLRPIIRILEVSSEEQWSAAERRHIALLRQQGAKLLNRTGGGYGLLGFHFTVATRRKMSLAAKGRIISPAQRRKISKGLTGKKQSFTTRRKRSLSVRRAYAKSGVRRRHRTSILKFSRTRQYRRKQSRITKAAWARRKSS